MRFGYISVIILSVFMVFASCDNNTDEIGTSLIGELDDLDVTRATYKISTRSIVAGAVLSRNSTGYLGKIRDPETGAYITGNFTTQFHTLENYEFPELDSIRSLINGEVVADSCELRLYYTDFYGDSLTTMKLTAYEMQTPMSEGEKYYSDFDPISGGLVRNDGIKVNKLYTLTDLNVSEETRNSDSYTPNIRIKLTQEYTDKDGVTYNNYGTYIMRKFYEDPTNFKNSYNFVHRLVPGFHFEIQSGLGSMAYVTVSQLNVYFRYRNDSVRVGTASFVGTEEVLLSTKIENDNNAIARLAADNTCTYIKSPAGIFTEMTLPIDEIMDGHRNDTLNTAKIVLPRINNRTNNGEYNLGIPQTLLMIPKSEMNLFFEESLVVDYRTSFVANYSSSNNSYTFNNISSLVKAMDQFDRSDVDWNKVVLIPVTVTYNSDAEIVRVAHDMSLTSTRLMGGSENPYEPLTIDVIYSKFK